MKFKRELTWIGLLTLAVVTPLAAAQTAELARVNGKVISDQDLKQAVGGFNEFQQESILGDNLSRAQILDNLINQELMVQSAVKQNLENTSEYKAALEAFRKQTLATLLVQKNLGSKMTDSEARKYYTRNQSRFNTDQVRAFHILLKTESRAKEILAMTKKSGADFQELAAKHSIDPSAKNNRGDVGFFGRERMVPDFTTPVFSAKRGSIIGPIKTAYGYHVVKVVEKRPGKSLNYDEVELKVKGMLKQELISQYIASLKQSAKIKISGSL